MNATSPIIAPSILSPDSPPRRRSLDRRSRARLAPLRRHGQSLRAQPHVRPAHRGLGGAQAHAPPSLDVHLMMQRPWRMIDEFRAAGADLITVHLEACTQTREVLRQDARETGAEAGLVAQARHALRTPPRPTCPTSTCSGHDRRARLRRPGVQARHDGQRSRPPRATSAPPGDSTS